MLKGTNFPLDIHRSKRSGHRSNLGAPGTGICWCSRSCVQPGPDWTEFFENILRGPVVEFPTQHSALRYASDGMLGQCEDLRIYSYEWYRNLSRFAVEYEPDALSAEIFATGHRCATLPESESIQAGFKQAPPKEAGSCHKRKASNLIQRFINLLTMAGIDLHCPLSGMAYGLRGNTIQTQTYCGRTGS